MTYEHKSTDALAIKAVNQELEAAMAASDASRLAAIYTKSAQLLPPNSPIIAGYDNIQAFWQSVLGLGIVSAKLETIELSELGDTAIEVGLFVMASADGAVVDNGKYIVIWRQVDGRWQYHRDIWSSSRALV